ncbi:radical SAM protein [Clostridium boliviensis]|uniref:Radical SAM protein n=1 Tax=Clostridium boliviensis TaxID=318465 RepID=A0ABU4GQM2_9CLOT|nr:radical SAM protein [Clostridium boliviensis]MDW2799926.1 radical SAM protein [Clostridium boliviensis]
MIRSTFLFLSPSETSLQYPGEIASLPLNLGLGVICGYLEQKGITVGMNDLNVSLSQLFGNADRKRLEAVYEYERFKNYLNTGEDAELTQLIEELTVDIGFESYDSYGVSIGADFSFLQIQFGFLLAKYLKVKYKKLVFVGGNNISFLFIFQDVFRELWELVLQQFEFVIKGAGERVIYEIIKSLNNGAENDIMKKIPGLVFSLKGGEIKANDEMKPIVVRPNWSGFDMSYYKRFLKKDKEGKLLPENLVYFFKWPDTYTGSPGQAINRYNRNSGIDLEPTLILPYIFNYNCPYNCAFCTQSDYDRGSIVGGDPDQVLNDILILQKKYDTKYFYFLNNAFNYSIKFVNEFCHKVIENNVEIYWSDCGRFNNLTYERLELMKKAGCVKLTFGFESGSQKIIDLIDKKIDLNHAKRVLQWCHDLGIWSDIEVIIGLPQELDEDFEETCHFIRENKENINYFWVNEYFVVPNSLIGRYPKRYGIELLKGITNYKKLLYKNLEFLQSNKTNIMTSNSKLYGFNEIGRRSYNEIVKSDRQKIVELNKLQNREFSQVSKFYSAIMNRESSSD